MKEKKLYKRYSNAFKEEAANAVCQTFFWQPKARP
ncbi:hypothetical protein A0O36_01794 [Piscirickettsiaceae bacterium NZ-RLO1]|nr:hypothetical protein A0O36_01794 [Piscirickettsiaceae bacterium NZ-RLO1]